MLKKTDFQPLENPPQKASNPWKILKGLCALSLCLATAPLQAADLPETVEFDAHIKPILSDRCFKCHGFDEGSRKADLRLDTREGLFAEAEDGPGSHVVLAGKPEASAVWQRVISPDPDELMPPPKSKLSLNDHEKALIKKWIEQGASYEDHWAFIPVERPTVPELKDDWVRNDIDRFVLQRLKQARLKPSPDASPEVLLRRLSFDLTGLPPTVEELDAFLADSSEQAYENTVDRLLASEGYGERMTVNWLDLARYADSYGFQRDNDRTVWPWRDWVIEAFNKNLPYDDFVTWQLAGDLLPEATREQIMATTFSRLHQQKVEGGTVPEEFRVEYVADRTHTFGTAFLGMSLECARCHDHKYDPLSIKEYYQFFAYFNNIDEAGLYSYFTRSVPTPTLMLTDENQEKQLESMRKGLADAENELKAIAEKQREAFAAWLNQRPEKHEWPKAVAIHPFDEEKPGKHENLVDAGKPASSGGGNKMVEGKTGRAIQLSGDDAVKLKVGNFHRAQPFSVSLWMKTPDVKERAVVFHRSRAWTDAASRGYQLLLEEGKLSASLIHFWPGNAIRVLDPEPLPTETWVHVAMTYDGSSQADGLQLYKNGKLVKTEVVRDYLTKEITGGGGNEIAIGERFRDRGFTGGAVDDFSVFSHELTPLEVQNLLDPDAAVQLAQKQGAALKAAEKETLFAYYLSSVNEAYRAKRDALAGERKRLNDTLNRVQEIMVMKEMPKTRQAYVLERGHYEARGEPISAATPAALSAFDPAWPQNRLGLSRWLTDPSHPLFSRVTVNRFWQMLFGQGLVGTTEEFGSQGERPSHPELLDWLSSEFMASGWDVKAVLKQMVMSSSYRQASTIDRASQELDPKNRLLWRGPRYRLPAEMVRDHALASAGLAIYKIGGAPVRPYDLELSFKPSKPTRGEGLYRRSLYTFWKRTGPAPVMMALDAVKRNVCVVKRETTSSPLQALVLMNGTQFVEAARVLAESVIKASPDPAERIGQAFRRLTSRTISDEQRKILLALFNEQKTLFAKAPEDAKAYLKVGDRKPDASLDTSELAALTVTVSAMMNFDQTVMKR